MLAATRRAVGIRIDWGKVQKSDLRCHRCLHCSNVPLDFKKADGKSSTLGSLEYLYNAFAKKVQDNVEGKDKESMNEDLTAAGFDSINDDAKRAKSKELMRRIMGEGPKKERDPISRLSRKRYNIKSLMRHRTLEKGKMRAKIRAIDELTGLDGMEEMMPQYKAKSLKDEARRNKRHVKRIRRVAAAVRKESGPIFSWDGGKMESSDDAYSRYMEDTFRNRGLDYDRGDMGRMTNMPKFESQAQIDEYEDQLIEKHLKAVKEVSWITEYLDISKFQGTESISEDEHPFLYNEKYYLGLDVAEAQWISGREKWRRRVEDKRMAVARRKQVHFESDVMVNRLFLHVVNLLARRPENGIPIHPNDVEMQRKAVEARERLKLKMLEIYNNYPSQWMEIIEKYLPKSSGMAVNVNNREFWSPENPWLMSAFTRSMIEEYDKFAEYFESRSDINAQVSEYLSESGEMKNASENFDIGPLGEDLSIGSDGDQIPAIPSAGQQITLDKKELKSILIGDETDDVSYNDGDEKSGKINRDDGGRFTEEEEGLEGQRDDNEDEMEDDGSRRRNEMSCFFCGPNRHHYPLDPMNVALLLRFMNPAGMIMGRKETGLCKFHQSKVSKVIKYSTHLGLFDNKDSTFKVNNPFMALYDFTIKDIYETQSIYPEWIKEMDRNDEVESSSTNAADSADLPSKETDNSMPEDETEIGRELTTLYAQYHEDVKNTKRHKFNKYLKEMEKWYDDIDPNINVNDPFPSPP